MLSATSLPGEDPVWTLIKSYEETRRNLHKLRTQIASLQLQETALEARRISVLSILAMVSRPARDKVFATFDIMERIFEHAVSPTSDDAKDAFYSHAVRNSDAYPVVHAIARVCSLWRATAIHASSLWQRITFSGWRGAAAIDFACTSFRLCSWLRRSLPLPLTIHWSDDQSSYSDEVVPWMKSLFDALAAHSPRWQTAKLRIPFPQYSSFFPLTLPNLKDLYFRNNGDGSAPSLGSMPSLRNLALSGLGVISQMAFPWHHLTTLRFFGEIRVPRQTIQACLTLERLYIDMDNIVSPFHLNQTTKLPSLCHLSLRFPLQKLPLTFLDLVALDSITISYRYHDLPPLQESVQFLSRSSRLRILQIDFEELGFQDHSHFSVFSSSTVHILRLKLTNVLGDPVSCLLKFVTISHLKEQFSALEEIHIDATSTEEGAPVLTIESVIFTAVQLASTGAQMPSLKSVWLHIPAAFIESLSHTRRSISKLQLSSTPLDFDNVGIDYFMDGHCLLAD
ncbi:hypothetical protein DL96DRAFT_1611437 [Flagelloscypha sp. PMI_526]|nr:hypothetical protein DL96DRAFT_1611437 [Flagelloscypha sp. PMI_526]